MDADKKNKLENLLRERIKINSIKAFLTNDYLLLVSFEIINVCHYQFFEDINEIINIKAVHSGFNHYKNYIVLHFNFEGIKTNYEELETVTEHYFDEINLDHSCQ